MSTLSKLNLLGEVLGAKLDSFELNEEKCFFSSIPIIYMPGFRLFR